MKNIIAVIIVFLSSGTLCMAQSTNKGQSEFYINWVSGVPVGNNFITEYSPRGWDLGYNKFISDKLAVGFEMGWNNYYQYQPKRTYQFEAGAATTDLYKYIYTLPIVLNATRYFGGGHFTPFVRLGLGAQYSEQNLYYNVYETSNNNWGFVVIPEVGALFRFGLHDAWGLNAAIRYSASTNSASNLGISSVETLSLELGFAWVLR